MRHTRILDCPIGSFVTTEVALFALITTSVLADDTSDLQLNLIPTIVRSNT